MRQEVLSLSTSGGRLWRTIRQPIAECLAEARGRPPECRRDSGTTVAARWHHRDSFDVDLTVSATANLGSLPPRLDDAMKQLGRRPNYHDGHLMGDSPSTGQALDSGVGAP